jgi:histone deacetylase 6
MFFLPPGNGTQDIFWEDPSVLYLSLHRYGLGFFPSTGAASDTGAAGTPAAGATVNIPFTETHLTGADYLAAFRFIVVPILTEFRPDVTIISAGFDAAVGDPLGKMSLAPSAFGALTDALLGIGTGRVVAALEGGYNEDAISSCAESVVRALLRGAPGDAGGPAASSGGVTRGRGARPRGGTEGALRAARAAQLPFWRCLSEPGAEEAFEAFWAEERDARARRSVGGGGAAGASAAPRMSTESGSGSPTRSGGSDGATTATTAGAEATELHDALLASDTASCAASPSRSSAAAGAATAPKGSALEASSPA